jgi:hypothetical protein
MVEERGARLRELPFAKIKELANEPVENVVVGPRKGTIGTIVLALPSGGIQVVVQGFLKHRFMPGKSVAMNGFYKYPDETIAPMTSEEFWDFD